MAGSKTWFVIINPISGNGSSKKKWPRIQELLIAYQFSFDYAFTAYPNHGTELTQHAIKQGFKHFICVGGDGTLHNIVNGIMLQKKVPSSLVHVGVIPIGTGNDWVKTHSIPHPFKKAIQLIKNGQTMQQDVGKIELTNTTKKPIYFINLAGIGFDGLVVSKVHKYKHFGALAYIVGAILSLFLFKSFHVKVVINSKVFQVKTLMVLIGICKYSGGGMQLTQTPNPFDGLLDISLFKNIAKWDIIKNISKLFNGNITYYNNKVDCFKSTSLSIDVLDNNKPFIEADGELIGTGNIRISIRPNAFSFYAETKNAKQKLGVKDSSL